MPKGKFKILVTHPEIHPNALSMLKRKCDITICENVGKREEILEKSKGMDGILWATNDKLDAEILNVAGSTLTVISTISSELDYVDINEIRYRNIKLGHTPIVSNQAIADIVIGLMIATGRRFYEGRQKIETSTWENWHLNWMLGKQILGAIIGFVGFGGIAQAVTRRLRGFSVCKIIYFHLGDCENENDCEASYVRFDDLLKESDFIIIACPLNSKTKDLFNESVFNKMKSDSILINISNGEIVNQHDLYNALKNGKMFAAGLDVTTPQPLPNDDLLLSLPNCVITPNLGSATYKAREKVALVAANNLLNGLLKRPMITPACLN